MRPFSGAKDGGNVHGGFQRAKLARGVRKVGKHEGGARGGWR